MLYTKKDIDIESIFAALDAVRCHPVLESQPIFERIGKVSQDLVGLALEVLKNFREFIEDILDDFIRKKKLEQSGYKRFSGIFEEQLRGDKDLSKKFIYSVLSGPLTAKGINEISAFRNGLDISEKITLLSDYIIRTLESDDTPTYENLEYAVGIANSVFSSNKKPNLNTLKQSEVPVYFATPEREAILIRYYLSQSLVKEEQFSFPPNRDQQYNLVTSLRDLSDYMEEKQKAFIAIERPVSRLKDELGKRIKKLSHSKDIQLEELKVLRGFQKTLVYLLTTEDTVNKEIRKLVKATATAVSR